MSPSALTSSGPSQQPPVESSPVTDTSINDTNNQTLQSPVNYNLTQEKYVSRQSVNSDPGSSQDGVPQPPAKQSPPLYPRLACQVNLYQDQLIFTQDGRDMGFRIPPQSARGLQMLCLLMDGQHSVAQLQQQCAPDHPEIVDMLVQHLEQQGFICTEPPHTLSEEDIVSQLQRVTHRWLNKRLSQQTLTTHELLKGWGIESYHLFSQLQYSCSSLLSYAGTPQTQTSIKALYTLLEDYVKTLRAVLNTLGVSEADIHHTLPLPSTMTVVNGLTFWANTEPLFCLNSLGLVLDHMGTNVEGYIAALDGVPLATQDTDTLSAKTWLTNTPLVAAMKSLIHNQQLHSPLSLVREIFAHAHLGANAQIRMHNQSHLLADMLCSFYVGIDQHYDPDAHKTQSLSILRTPGKKLGFKDGVLLSFTDTKIELRYEEQGFAIAISEDGQQSLGYALKLLQMGGISPEQLDHACPDLQEYLPDILAECDRHNLLRPCQALADRFNVHDGCSGSQFYQELLRFLTWLKRQFPPSPLSQQMTDGTISRSQLIGYALESYHVTALCPRLLAPALAHPESPQTQTLLRDFFVSELHHDRLMEKSLRSVGVPSSHLQHIQPLPTTFSVCSYLGVFARQHPLSFKAALMLFEEDDHHFHELFEHCCQALELPSEFYRPILLHARINDEGEHDQITADLLAEIPYISPEDQLLVKKNMALLMEAMVLRTQEILHYYGHASSVFPRLFSASF